MSITLQPPFDLLPSYRPIALEVFATTLDTLGPVENALVTIFKDLVPVVEKIPYKSNANATSIIPLSTDYFFYIDVQKFCQELLGPSAGLPSIFPDKSISSAQNNDMFFILNILITYQYIDATTGLLTDLLITDLANPYAVFVASRQNQELMSLEDYLGTNPTTADRLFLTKSARTLKLCASDNAFLTTLQESNAFPTNGVRVLFFDAAGGFLDFGLAFLPAPTFAGQVTLNTGLESLANVVWVDGAPTLPNPLIASYTVQFGFVTVTPGPIYSMLVQTETFTYEVKAQCCDRKSLRLHWMNLLGGPDSYTFDEDKDLKLATSHNVGQKALGWGIGSTTPNNVSDVGNMKLKSEGRHFYDLNSKILTNTESAWLQEMLTSPKVYAEIDGDMIAVIVEKTTQSVTRDTGKIRFPIRVTIANDLIIQRS